MTFSDLRALIAAEMPPGWGWSLIHHAFHDVDSSGDGWQLDVWTGNVWVTSQHSDTPDALLAAWRELKGKLA